MEDLNGDLYGDCLSGLGDEGGSLESNDSGQEQNCSYCDNKLCSPRVLSCLHVYCEACIDKLLINEAGDSLKFDLAVECPSCKQETKVPVGGASSLPSDYVITNILDVSSMDQSVVCTCCKSKDPAVARCTDCTHFLCSKCNGAHEFMRCFEKHRVVPLEALRSSKETVAVHKPILCFRHAGESLKYYCRECEVGVCTECLALDHKVGEHHCERIADVEPVLRAEIRALVAEAASRATAAGGAASRLDDALGDLQRQREEAESLLDNAFRTFTAAIERKRESALEELQKLHKERELKVMDIFERVDNTIQRIDRACKFAGRLLRNGDGAEIVMLKKTISSQFLRLLKTTPDLDANYSIEFVTEIDKFEQIVDTTFGYFRTESTRREIKKPASESSGIQSPGITVVPSPAFDDYSITRTPAPLAVVPPPTTGIASIVEYNLQQLASIAEKETPPAAGFTLAELLTSDLSSPQAYNNLRELCKIGLNTGLDTTPAMAKNYFTEKMNGYGGGIPRGVSPGRVLLGDEPVSVGAPAPVVRTTKAAPMHVRNKFGQLGSGKGQFNSPHGFCLGNDEDIIVADTNNHRITVFDKTGIYKFHFGVAGKEEGQLWYPRKVAVIRSSGKFIVCDRGNERSRMQIFTKNGHFLKKIAVRFIDIVAGLAVTPQGLIVTVDSVTPTVFIISENGDLLRWFDCSECMREPSDIAISGKEFYVCDFKGHCVVVFDEDGRFLRRIGCENVTNFPNGIDVSDAGDVLIGDSHGNKFHVVVYERSGTLVTEFECPYVKVSRCCGLKITSEGHIVTLAKNNHHVLVLDTLYVE